ncbi:MAG: hypothetical protein SFY96_12250 [Planctomycetota bacterium]|nr:hypothetical protein [Planctomycetota bacterium]
MRATIVCLCASGLLVFAGCASSGSSGVAPSGAHPGGAGVSTAGRYLPRVENRTGQVVSLRLYRDDGSGRKLLLMREPHINPGAALPLGQFSLDSGWTLIAEAEPQAMPGGAPARRALGPGERLITIGQDANGLTLDVK